MPTLETKDANDLIDKGSEKAKEAFSDARDYIGEKVQQVGDQVKESSSELMKGLCQMVQDKPLTSIAIAACIGAVVTCFIKK